MFGLIVSDIKDSFSNIKKSFVSNINYFFSTYVIIVLLYQLFINNLLMNAEDTMGTPTFYLGGAWNVSLGRYLYAVWQVFYVGINAEPLNTMLAIFIFCLCIFLVFDIFKDNKMLYLFSTLMIMSSPMVYYGLSHRYSSVAGSLSILLSIISIRGLICYKNSITKFIFSTLFLTMSLALGQYAIGLTALVLLFYCVYAYICKKEELTRIFKIIYQYIIVFVLGLLLYRFTWIVSMKLCKVSAPSYVGASDISVFSIITMFPSAFIKSYSIMIDYLNGSLIKFNIFGAYIINYTLIIIALISIFVYTYKKYKSILTALLVDFALIVFIPPILSITIFFTPAYQYIRPHQMITFALFMPMLILLVKKIFYAEDSKTKAVKIFKPMYLILAVVLFHSQILQMSVDFDTMYRSKNSLENIYMLILNKIENKNLLDSKKNYYIYGNFYHNELFYVQDFKDRYTKLDKVNYRFVVGNVNGNDWWGQFLKNQYVREYMGINISSETPYEKYKDYFETEQFKSIKSFPADESIFEISENDVIIKVSE